MSGVRRRADSVMEAVRRARLGPADLRAFGDRPALLTVDSSISHAELADLVEDRICELGTDRRLIELVGERDATFVVTLLAALHAGLPVVIANGDAGVAAAGALAADVAVDARSGEPALHPDLALLMSTSGSTGSAKFVRLSRDAVLSNAAAIADYLALGPGDVGISSLPFHYCYGLSVLTSHLAVGAGIALTDLAVVDPCFTDLVVRRRVTSLAGVPHTFEMLERSGSELLAAPSLRSLMQAGGRLAPEHVVRLAASARANGIDLFVMYGQTEATARMAYLSPGEVFEAPASVGRAIPGGEIHLADVNADGVGEIVYRGPNVMMGYAERAADLARGHELDELRTGDLGRFDDVGRLHVVGRSSRFLKIHGVRVDLDHLEHGLGLVGPQVHCVGDDDGLVVARVDPGQHRPESDPGLAAIAADMASIPAGRVRGVCVGSLPRTTSGKLDGPALQAVADGLDESSSARVDTVADVFALVLGRRDIDPVATFASLGGDSFSYVEMSVQLERVLGYLPSGWHLTSVRDLEALRPTEGPRRRWTMQLDTSVVVRAIAILLIVATHMRIFRLAGGAHTLLAVLGWNFARFQLAAVDVPARFRKSMSSVARIAVPTSAWIGINMIVAGGYGAEALFLVNNYFGHGERSGGRWEYWYFEAFVQISIVLAIAFAIPAIRRVERRGPFLFAAGVLGLTWLFRFDVVQWGHPYNEVFRPHTIASFVALGWMAYRAQGVWQKLAVTLAALVTTFGYFQTVGYVDQFDREARIFLMIAALIWIPTVRLPRLAAPIVATIAAASMWIFLVHWQVWPALTPLMDDDVAYVLTIGVGIAVWWVAERVPTWVGQSRLIGRKTSNHVSTADSAMRVRDATPVSA